LKFLKHLVRILKIVVPLAIIAWLLSTIDPQQWEQLRDRPKHWGLLSLAFAIELVAVCLTFVRWYLLVLALGIPFTLPDAFRLSFLAYLLNFVSAGSVGGDLFKAIFIAREHPRFKTEAVASVIVDRVVGLFALLVVASIAIFMTGSARSSAAYEAVTRGTLIATGCGAVGVVVLLISSLSKRQMAHRVAHLPFIGHPLERMMISVRVYRDRKSLMFITFVISMGIHVLASVALFLVARALFGDAPTLAEHMLIVPLSMAAGALPLSPSGLGSLEFAMTELYKLVPATVSENVSGILVALVFRLVTIAIAAVGVVYYLTARAKVQEVLDAAEESSGMDDLVPEKER
jgi:uncharacterized protein (TIRG00374 family)